MPPRILNPALRMRFLCPPTTRPISTTPHLFGGGPRPKKVRNFTRSKGPKIPKSRSVLSATSFTSNPRRHKALKVPKPVFVKPVIRKIMPTGPSRDLIHYIPPSNPLRQKLGPGMYYNTKLDMHRCSSTPLDKDVETEYLYTLMLRRTFSTPLVPIKAVALRGS
ncbi:hypothetical protein C7212DRAFT_366879 [Tuber magnatum]|uniref:Uncharacterized protein n=1 Tax=Tuber magnatum TaxID=42249 RepID=A0A317SCG4_9PEZI|nr:hypothetical protein C7212DRAFT_366879 [Tuber magnatum]